MPRYSQGATGLLAEYAVKKYRSHRTVTANDLTKAREEKEKRDLKHKHVISHSL